MKECFKKKLVISRLTWDGNVEIMGDEKLAESRYLESGWEKETRKAEIGIALRVI